MDALVPTWADLAVVGVRDDDRLRVVAFAHIDPRQMPWLEEFQRRYRPAINDAESVMARVVRSRMPELMSPFDPIVIERDVKDPGLRAILRAIGPRVTLFAPIVRDDDAAPIGVLIAATSSSGRALNADDLETLTKFARAVGPRLHW